MSIFLIVLFRNKDVSPSRYRHTEMTESMSIHDDAEVSTVDFCLPIKLVRREEERERWAEGDSQRKNNGIRDIKICYHIYDPL